MTANLINYWRNQEERRSNLAQEAEVERSHRAVEQETERSNRAREAETARNNMAVLIETSRHNFEMEDASRRQATAALISASAASMNAQTQAKKQVEDARHNVALEQIQEANNWYQSNLRGMELEETIRTNTVRETETQRHNQEMEQAALVNNVTGTGIRIFGKVGSTLKSLFRK